MHISNCKTFFSCFSFLLSTPIMYPNIFTLFSATTNTSYANSNYQKSSLLLPSLYSSTNHPDGCIFPQLPPLYRYQQNEFYVPQQTYRVLPNSFTRSSPNPFTRSNLVNISLNNKLNVGFSRTQNSLAVLPTINLPQTLNSSLASKAARMKRKMAMKRKSSSSTRRCSSSSTTRFNKRASLINTKVNNIYNFYSPCGKKLKFVFEKVLTKSDFGSLGRIILPKKPSMENLPALGDDGKGIHIALQDIDSPIMWHMRYRFVINNERKIYILENTGNYVNHHDLKTEDRVTVYIDESNLLHISSKKAEPSLNAAQHDGMYPVAATSLNAEGPDAGQHDDVYPVAANGNGNLPDFASFSDFDDFPWFD